jgi:N-acetyl-gamma-glutamyl-phosphate reductase
MDASKVIRCFSEFAEKNEFVHFMGKGNFPEIKMTVHSNRCMIGAESDESGQNWVIVSSLDNLIKGASGQAIQNMNLMCGLDEALGLT